MPCKEIFVCLPNNPLNKIYTEGLNDILDLIYAVKKYIPTSLVVSITTTLICKATVPYCNEACYYQSFLPPPLPTFQPNRKKPRYDIKTKSYRRTLSWNLSFLTLLTMATLSVKFRNLDAQPVETNEHGTVHVLTNYSNSSLIFCSFLLSLHIRHGQLQNLDQTRWKTVWQHPLPYQ